MTTWRTLGLTLAVSAALLSVLAGPAAASRPTAFAATTPSIPVRDPSPPISSCWRRSRVSRSVASVRQCSRAGGSQPSGGSWEAVSRWRS